LLDDGWVQYREDGDDRYVLLYTATGFKSDEEMGLIFDQYTNKAAFVEDFDEMMPVLDYGYGWKPLEDIFTAYLEMIQEGKVELSSPDGTWTRKSLYNSIGPWRLHEFSKSDVQKSAQAFKRLVDAIEARLPPREPTSPQKIQSRGTYSLAWAESSTLDAAHNQGDTYARAFCEETPKFKVSFRYIAPGLRIPTVEELIAQPHHESYS
jgi:hypothetical protein